MAFPEDLKLSVFGRQKRFYMFVRALRTMGDLDILFYVRSDLEFNSDFVRRTEEKLTDHWGVRVRLELCNLAAGRERNSRWQEYIGPALNIVNQRPYLNTSQTEQIRAVDRFMENKPDILFVHRLTCMIPLLLSKVRHERVYFDLDDIEHVALARSINQPPLWPAKKLYHLKLPVLKRWERRAISYSRTTFVCSEHDRQYLSGTFGCNNVEVIPNAIDIPDRQEYCEKPTLLFLGVMSYPPNAAASDHMIKNIWPLIRAELPGARLLIAGADPEQIPSFSDQPGGVEFLGFVDNLDKLYHETAVVCCPILAGGGTRIKILEAAAYGKPVVSTVVGAEGIDLRDGDEILLCDDPKSFAEACIRLLKDKTLAAKIGRAARSVVEEKYDTGSVVDKIRMQFKFTDSPQLVAG